MTIKYPNKFSIPFLVWQFLQCIIQAERSIPGNPYSHREVPDPEGKFLLEWVADPKKDNVIFNITAATRGYVAIGFSKTGKMPHSDILIGGMGRNGVPYLLDRHTFDGRIPIEDIRQDWKLLKAWENKTHTSIRFVRKMETCDPQDLPVNDDTIHLMWAYGENDVLDYHASRGSFQTHLLQPDLTPLVPSASKTLSGSSLDVWRLSVNIKQNSTAAKTYHSWCVFQKGPELEKKHHIIGFSTANTNKGVKMNLDRLVIYKCIPTLPHVKRNSTDAVNEKFQQLVDFSGECKNATEIFSYCQDIIFTSGKGSKDIFLPKDTGIPFGVQEEYYLLESYLTPAQNKSEEKMEMEREIGIDVDFLLTDGPRKYEAKILKIGHNPMSPLFIPPGSLEFEVFGHCANDCTERIIPRRKALRIFGVSFDTGEAGKSVTLHHIRNAHQIPLILEDVNHDPSFQQMLILGDETPIRPGDQITVRCTFDSTIRSDKPPHSLHSSSVNSTKYPPARCLAYLWYFSEINGNSSTKTFFYPECTSILHPNDFAKWIIQNTPKNVKRNSDFHQLFNKLNTVKWTPRLRLSLYQLYKFGKYLTSCGTKHGQPMNTTIDINIKSGSTNIRNNGTNKTGASSSSAAGDLTVSPLPVEQIPYTMGCPTLAGSPVLFGLPGPVIFGFP